MPRLYIRRLSNKEIDDMKDKGYLVNYALTYNISANCREIENTYSYEGQLEQLRRHENILKIPGKMYYYPSNYVFLSPNNEPYIYDHVDCNYLYKIYFNNI